ncbi:hypothetical protein GBA52_015423 [Prunus armeniaca]|nr:hypothetical protein GBA52_015423 [Prunus armeniaca]
MKVLLLLLTPARSGRMTLLNLGSDHYLVHWTMLVSKRSLINRYSRMEGTYRRKNSIAQRQTHLTAELTLEPIAVIGSAG